MGRCAIFTQRCTVRQGSLLLEVIVGAALLATLLVLINQIVVRLHGQTARVDKYYVAQQTLENLLEEFSSRPWADLDSAAIRELELSPLASSKLPQGRIDGEVVPEMDRLTAKRITLRIGWRDTARSERRPPESTAPPLTTRTLTTWVYQQVEDKP